MDRDTIEFKGLANNIPGAIAAMKNMEQAECPVEHFFAHGQYLRKTFMPKGTFAIGKKHRYKTINILLQGHITVYNGDNEPIREIKAPEIWVSEAGVQKMAYFHEDTVWLNPHPTELTDIDKIEEEFIVCEDADKIEELKKIGD